MHHQLSPGNKQQKIISNQTSVKLSTPIKTATMLSSKLLVLQQNHLGDSSITTEAATSTTSTPTYLNGQDSGGGGGNIGKLVFVTTEQMDVGNSLEHNQNGGGITTTVSSNSGNDEELTSLTWLHDKNLLKGINISCPPNVKHINNNNHVKIVSDTSSSTSVRHHQLLHQQKSTSTSGTVTPTSDFHDESCVSEDNVSSVHSSSDQGISIYSRNNNNNNTSPNSYRYLATTLSSSQAINQTSNNLINSNSNKYHNDDHDKGHDGDDDEDDDDYDDNDDDNNNNNHSVNNKNRTVHHHLLSTHHNQPPPASSIIHLSPGGSTVIEYKTTSNLQQKLNTISASTATSTPLVVGLNYQLSTVITSHGAESTTTTSTNGTKAITVAATTTSNAQQITPHTHFHKKYIKQMNALNGGTGSDASVAISTTAATTTMVATLSSPTTITANAPATYTIPIRPEYSPMKYEHGTVIVENEYPHASITVSGQAGSHHIYHGGDIDRHSDEYVTPISSPRHQLQQPTTPHKNAVISINSAAQSPTTTISIPSQSIASAGISMSPVSPTSNAQQNNNKPKAANNLPYDPFIHTNNKPPLSFSSLIFLAIEDAQEKALPVKEIYSWIVQHYPYFKTAPTGWKNSVRHNLSLNKCFQKVEKAPNMGKGSLWRVEQQYKQNLIIALTRSSYHPNTTAMEKATASFKNTPRSSESPPLKTNNTRPLDAELFPRLSKFMANMNNGNVIKGAVAANNNNIIQSMSSPAHVTLPAIDDDYQMHNGNVECYHVNGDGVVVRTTTGAAVHNDYDHEMCCINNVSVGDIMETQRVTVERIARDWGVDSIDDVNAATAMLALKHGPKVFAETFQTGTPIITSVPSEDHTYSAGGNGAGSKRLTTVNNGTAPAVAINGNANNINSNNLINIITTTNLVHAANNNSSSNNNINNIIDNRHNNNSDNISNGTSSDAVYESSEESQNVITAEELEARRHQEGVDAFLSFATEVSSMSSPIKRPPSADYIENIPSHHHFNHHHHSNNNHIFANNNNNSNNGGNAHHSYYFYDGGSSPSSTISTHHPFVPTLHQNQQQAPSIYSYLSTPSPPKKSRTRTLRTKLKKKTTWLR